MFKALSLLLVSLFATPIANNTSSVASGHETNVVFSGETAGMLLKLLQLSLNGKQKGLYI